MLRRQVALTDGARRHLSEVHRLSRRALREK
jgi:hypothetical protein